MKLYQKLSKHPDELADYITNKLEVVVKKIVEKTGNIFYYDELQHQLLKTKILNELMKKVEK